MENTANIFSSFSKYTKKPKIKAIQKPHNPGFQLFLYDQLTSNYFSQGHDFLLSAYPVNLPHCRVIPIYNEAFYLAVSREHPLAAQSDVLLENLKDESFILLPKGHIFREMCEAMCSKAGFSPNVGIECYPSQISELLENTLNVAFTIESALYSNEFGSDIRLLPISTPGCFREILLVYPENTRLTFSAKLCLQYCRMYKSGASHTQKTPRIMVNLPGHFSYFRVSIYYLERNKIIPIL